MKNNLLFLFCICIELGSSFCYGQQKNADLHDLFDLLEKQSYLNKNKSLEIEAIEINKKLLTSFAPTDFQLEQGQINTTNPSDYFLTMSQTMPSVWKTGAQKAVLDKKIALVEISTKVELLQIKENISKNYNEILYQKNKIHLLKIQQVKCQQIQQKAKAMLAAGQRTQLLVFLTEQAENELIDQIKTCEIAALQAESNIFQWIESPAVLWTDSLVVFDQYFDFALQENKQASRVQQIEAMQQLTVNEQTMIKRERLPDFSLGAFTQKLEGREGYFGWMLGMKVPLWTNQVRKQIQIKNISYEQSDLKKNFEKNRITTHNENLQKQIELHKNQISYRENQGKKIAELIENQSTMLFSEGESDLNALFAVYQNSFENDLKRLQTIFQLNNVLIEQYFLNQ